MTENDALIMRQLTRKTTDNGVTYELIFKLEELRDSQSRTKARIQYLIDNGLVIRDASDGSYGSYKLTPEGSAELEDYELQQNATKAKQSEEKRHKRINLLLAIVGTIIAVFGLILTLAVFLFGEGFLNKPNQPNTHISAETATPPPSTSSPQLTPAPATSPPQPTAAPPKSNFETQTSSPLPTVNPNMTNLETETQPLSPTSTPVQNDVPLPYYLELISSYVEDGCCHIELSYLFHKDGIIEVLSDYYDLKNPNKVYERVSRSFAAGDSGTITFDLDGAVRGQNIEIYLRVFDRTRQEWIPLEKIPIQVA
jgi:Uncharacterized protein conserved in bacteria